MLNLAVANQLGVRIDLILLKLCVNNVRQCLSALICTNRSRYFYNVENYPWIPDLRLWAVTTFLGSALNNNLKVLENAPTWIFLDQPANVFSDYATEQHRNSKQIQESDTAHIFSVLASCTSRHTSCDNSSPAFSNCFQSHCLARNSHAGCRTQECHSTVSLTGLRRTRHSCVCLCTER